MRAAFLPTATCTAALIVMGATGAASAQPGAVPPEPEVTTTVEAPPPEPAPALEELGPRQRTIDVGGFLGLNAFGDDIELGNAWAYEQVPGTAVVLGGRIGVTLLPDLARSSSFDPQVGVEGELKIALSGTGESMDGGRSSYFAPVFGWRLHAIGRLRSSGRWHPHLVVGVGGESVVSKSPFMADDTDAAFYWGPGVSWRASDKFVLRADLRHGLTAGRVDDVVSTFELLIGLEKSFDFGGRTVEQLPPLPPPRDTDGDGIMDPDDACVSEPETVNGYNDTDGCPDTLDQDSDGILDASDACIHEPEDVDEYQDDDGCPEPDNDADGLLDPKDSCPLDAEDFDQFQDEDGCPDRDDDADGIEDRADGCPREPETLNGFEDSDGCPDAVPKVIKEFTGVIAGITFEYSRARIQKKSKKTLSAAAAVLREYPDLRVLIEGHTDNKGIYDKNVSLSFRRAEAVKWHLVDLGIAADRIETAGLGPDRPRDKNKTKKGRARNRRIEFHLIIAAPPPPVTNPDPGTTEPSTPPTEPSTPPTEPSTPPTEPSTPPTEPSTPPAEPSTPPAEPIAPPVEPAPAPPP